MSIENISISIRAWHPDGEHGPAAAMFDTLPISAAAGVRRAETPGVPRIELVALTFGDFTEQDEPSGGLAAAVQEGLVNAARWMATQSPDLFASLRATGFVTDLFIGAWIDSDQIDLDLPPEFLGECARHGLPIQLITND